MSTALTIVRSLLKTRVEYGGFDRILEKVNILKAGDGNLTAELTLDKEHCNRRDTIHGGLTATIVDSISTLALVSLDIGQSTDAANFKESPSASVQLNISYMRPLKLGETVIIECSTLRRGRTLAYLNVDLLNKADGKLIARGTHTKAFLELKS